MTHHLKTLKATLISHREILQQAAVLKNIYYTGYSSDALKLCNEQIKSIDETIAKDTKEVIDAKIAKDAIEAIANDSIGG